MTHARIPDFSVPLALPALRLDEMPLPWHADPIFAAVERHSEAWSAFQVAPDGDGGPLSHQANDEMEAALDALLATPCASRQGAFVLLRHLRWWLGEEVEFADDYQPAYGIASARAADLALLLGCEAVQGVTEARPLGLLAAAFVARVPRSDGAEILALPVPKTRDHVATSSRGHVKEVALTGLGEALATLALIVGGCGAVGLATLL